ncbi:hypothetical protein ScPMuIL_001230 [Solemya velum]
MVMKGNDSVTECIIENKGIHGGVYHAYNVDMDKKDTDQHNSQHTDTSCENESTGECKLDAPEDLDLNGRRDKDSNRLPGQLATIGLDQIGSSHADGTFMCHFTQTKVYSVNDSQIFDLRKEWMLMFAHGEMDSNNPVRKSMHAAEHPPVTTEPVNFGQHRDIRLKQRKAGGHQITIPEGAGITLAAFMTARKGSDSVIECVMDSNGQVEVYNSYNEDDEDDNERLSTEVYSKGRTISHGSSHVDGVLKCSFQRENNPHNSTKHIFNLDYAWHLLFAVGLMDGGHKLRHSLDPEPWATKQKVSLQTTSDIVVLAEEKSYAMKKLHGSLMVLAWIACASIGVVIARYYTLLCPERKFFGTMLWFQIHRTLMVAATVLTVISVIVIFVEEGKWVEIGGSAFVRSHPVCGILVLLFSITNPIMAVFRCDPKLRKGNISILLTSALECSLISSEATIRVKPHGWVNFDTEEVIQEINGTYYLSRKDEEKKEDENNIDEVKIDEIKETRVQKITRIALYVHLGAIVFLSFLIILFVAIPQ